MPRKERLFIAGMPQMIAFKGNNNEAIFCDKEDYLFFVSCLKQATEQHRVALYAFSLLEKQIFLLLSANDKALLARFTQYLGRCYVPYFNKRHGRTGVLWEGRYRSCSIEPNSYFLLCQKYVETMVPKTMEGESAPSWSSLGMPQLDFLTPHPVYQALAPDRPRRHARYLQFLAIPLGSAFIYRIEECLRQNCVLGPLNYCLELEERLHQPVRPRLSGRPRKHYPDKLNYWQWLEQEAESALQGLGYREIRLPLLDGTADQGQWASALRSEGTMGCLTTIAEKHKTALPVRLWYQGPMFRTHHLTGQQVEQFHQIGAEALGFNEVDIELEQLLIQYDLVLRLKLSSLVELQINTLGDAQDIERYRHVLRQHFSTLAASFSPVQQQCLLHAPETLLVAAAGLSADVLAQVPLLADCLSDASLARFNRLTQALESAGVPFTHRQDLFPHKPYYQQTFFEWSSAHLDAHPVLARGGRYDDVASRIMGRRTPACGFAFMVEPLIQLAEKARTALRLNPHGCDIVIMSENQAAIGRSLHLGQILRHAYPYLAVVNDYASGRWSTRLLRAQKAGARIIIRVAPNDEMVDLIAGEQRSTQRCLLADVVGQVRHWLI